VDGLLALGRSDDLDLFGTLLGLFSLLGGSGSLGSLALGQTNSLWLFTLGDNLLPGGTDDRALNLDSLACALLGNLFGDTLLVEATEVNSPGELAGILLAHKVGLALLINETRGLAVCSDNELTMAWVDLEA